MVRSGTGKKGRSDRLNILTEIEVLSNDQDIVSGFPRNK